MKVRKATPPECIERDRVTFEAWGRCLSLERFIDRERRLRAHPWSQKVMSTWLLENDQGEILSSCETFKVPSQWRAESGNSYAFASVFTDKQLRGKGYASVLISRALSELERVDGSVQSFVLYSEVGEAIYARQGFEAARSSREWVMPQSEFFQESPEVEYYSDSEAAALLAAFLRGLDSCRGQKIVLRPSLEQLDWHWERERIYAEELQRPLPERHVVAAGSAFVFWAANYASDRLYALLFRGGERGETDALLRDGARLCRRLGLKQMAIWDTPSVTGMPASIHPGSRADSIAMLRSSSRCQGLAAKDWDEVPRVLWV